MVASSDDIYEHKNNRGYGCGGGGGDYSQTPHNLIVFSRPCPPRKEPRIWGSQGGQSVRSSRLRFHELYGARS